MLNRIAPALAPGTTLKGTEDTLPTEGGRVRKEKKVVYVQPFLGIIEQQLINYSLLINRPSPYAPTPTKKRKRAAPSGFRFRYLPLFV